MSFIAPSLHLYILLRCVTVCILICTALVQFVCLAWQWMKKIEKSNKQVRAVTIRQYVWWHHQLQWCVLHSFHLQANWTSVPWRICGIPAHVYCTIFPWSCGPCCLQCGPLSQIQVCYLSNAGGRQWWPPRQYVKGFYLQLWCSTVHTRMRGLLPRTGKREAGNPEAGHGGWYTVWTFFYSAPATAVETPALDVVQV